jgi:hypothetical protein
MQLLRSSGMPVINSRVLQFVAVVIMVVSNSSSTVVQIVDIGRDRDDLTVFDANSRVANEANLSLDRTFLRNLVPDFLFATRRNSGDFH